eukprot:s223_g45.t1
MPFVTFCRLCKDVGSHRQNAQKILALLFTSAANSLSELQYAHTTARPVCTLPKWRPMMKFSTNTANQQKLRISFKDSTWLNKQSHNRFQKKDIYLGSQDAKAVEKIKTINEPDANIL